MLCESRQRKHDEIHCTVVLYQWSSLARCHQMATLSTVEPLILAITLLNQISNLTRKE